MLDVALVGTGGMLPLPNRYLASLICRHNGNMVLFDCGEGTQVSLRLLGWGFKQIDCICLTHFHADHTAGLPGLLLAIGQAGREEPLTIIGPEGVAIVVRSLCIIAGEIPFDINFIEMPKEGLNNMQIPLTSIFLSSIPVLHNCPCYAFSLSIRRAGKFDAEAAKKLGIPLQLWSLLQKGLEVSHEGKVYLPDMVMGEERKGLKVSYCTDSRPPKYLPAFIEGSDIFVCEGQYGEDDLLAKAKSHRHMIFSEAATLAKNGNVSELWLTHFSPSMPEPSYYIKYASNIFTNTIIGYDRMHKTLTYV